MEGIDRNDDDLTRFEAEGAVELPSADAEGFVQNEGARLWYRTCGDGPAVILLHAGLGHSGNWGHQARALVAAAYRVVLIDSRGHGRSTRDDRPFSYELMASDVLAVMDHLRLRTASMVGWSDGACTALVLASRVPGRVSGVFFFGCNMDSSGAKPFVLTPVIDRCLARHRRDYAARSATPEAFDALASALGVMQRTQPNYTAGDLANIPVPVTIAHAERDEFITLEHASYLARGIPGARFQLLPEVSHFAPLQRPDAFNRAMFTFLKT